MKQNTFKKALILHKMSLNKNPHKQLWYQELKTKLEAKGYLVEIPVMPERFFGEATLEDLAKRYRYLLNSYSIRAGIELVIGHSVGGALGLYMSQYIPIKKLILVGAYMPPNLDYEAIQTFVEEVDIYWEEEDPSIPKIMSEAIITHLKNKKNLYKSSSKNHLNTLDLDLITSRLPSC